VTGRVWPDSLERALDQPITPRCPITCCFRLTCATTTQQGVLELWRDGKITQPSQCVFYERLAKLHEDVMGCPPPATAEQMLEGLRERRALQGEP